jgi:hypothetical protein
MNYAIRFGEAPRGTNAVIRVIEPDSTNRFAMRFVPR